MTERTQISTKDAPAAIGPYSQAIRVASGGELLFCSGQIPLDPETGEVVGGEDVRAQARKVLENLGAVLRAGGSDFDQVVKATVYLVDMADFAAVNEVYAEFLGGDEPPARAAFAVVGLPKGVKVEIEAIALVK